MKVRSFGKGQAATSVRGFRRACPQKGKTPRGKVCIELYAGCSGVSREIARIGGHAESYEILRPSLENLKLPSQWRSLYSRIRQGNVENLWIGITCASWSRAWRAPKWSRMPRALRDNWQYIYGLPDLEERDQCRVDDGNESLRFVSGLIRLCLEHHVMLVLDNPATSRLWSTPEMSRLLPKAASDDLVDYCAFGMTWRKRTRLAAWSRGLSKLPALCQGTKGICSFSGEKHELLEGTKGGVFKTAMASAYPSKLCRCVAPQLCQRQRT